MKSAQALNRSKKAGLVKRHIFVQNEKRVQFLSRTSQKDRATRRFSARGPWTLLRRFDLLPPLPLVGLIGLAGLFVMTSGLTGCASAYVKSIGGESSSVYSRIYFTDYDTAWQAVLETLKSARKDVTNREAGVIQTRWIENTAEKNFTDSADDGGAYLAAQYRVRVQLAKGFYNGKPSVKVSIQKEQLIQRDVLEGWRPKPTDSLEENTFLYRVGRVIAMKLKIAEMEEERAKRSMEQTQF